MIAKIITHEDDRKTAIAELAIGLYSLAVKPIKTNAAYLYRVCQLKAFMSGNVSTGLLPDHHDEVVKTIKSREEQRDLDVLMGAIGRELDKFWDSNNPKGGFASSDHKYKIAWRLNSAPVATLFFSVEDRPYHVRVHQTPGHWTYEINGEYPRKSHLEDAITLGDLEIASDMAVDWAGLDKFGVRAVEGVTLKVTKAPVFTSATSSSDAITAPMPGKIIALNCGAGDTVSEGDALVVMEAMKMEQTLTAPRDGVVAEVGAAVGELVTDGTVLVRLEEVQ